MGEFHSLAVADGTTMRAYAATPAVPPRRGVLVLQEAFGVNAHIRDVADRFAALGYRALAPELYHRTAAPGFEGDYADFTGVMPHLRALTANGQDNDLRACHEWMRQQGIEAVVAAGFCMGGRVAMRAAGTIPLQAAASFYGSDLASLRTRIPQIAVPLLLVWGDRDQHIPPEKRAEFTELLRQNQKNFVETTFAEAGHGFFCDARPAYHAPSARLAWTLLTAFFDQSL